MSRGNRLKKEKRCKDLDALTQSSLAFNPCVIMVGAGGDEKKVKVDSVFLLCPAGDVQNMSTLLQFFKWAASSDDDLINLLICFCNKHVWENQNRPTWTWGQSNHYKRPQNSKNKFNGESVDVLFCWSYESLRGPARLLLMTNACNSRASTKGSAGVIKSPVCSLMPPWSCRLNPPENPHACVLILPFCRSLRCWRRKTSAKTDFVQHILHKRNQQNYYTSARCSFVGSMPSWCLGLNAF